MDNLVVLSSAHRDALHDLCLDRLSGLGDLWPAIEGEEYGRTDHLGREFSDDLRLILGALGWGEATESVTLTFPPADLCRIFLALRDHAAKSRGAQERELAGVEQIFCRANLAMEACDQVLMTGSSAP